MNYPVREPMLARVLEPEVMDSPQEAIDYDTMDHSTVNRLFVADFLELWRARFPAAAAGEILDLGTGTAQIPIELLRRDAGFHVLAIDLAESMLALGRRNVATAGFSGQIQLERVDAKRLHYKSGRFAAVISNSIVHHIPEPAAVLAEASRVLRPGGLIFVRDLLRPDDDAGVRHLVDTYAAGANEHQRRLFEASLRAALSLEEVRDLVARLGHPPQQVCQTSDRHWMWAK
jgi:ubiquinone/menaquinone biosynthesis C-methylase UbiE